MATISYDAVLNSGCKDIQTEYWNGFEFTIVKANLKGDIQKHWENAKEAAKDIMPGMFPDRYNFSIKN